MSANPGTFTVPTTKLPVRAVLRPEGIDDSRRDELAHASGFREGYLRAATEAAGALEQAAERLDAAGEEAAQKLAETAIELAFEISKSILGMEVDAGRYDIEKIVRESLSWSGVGRGQCTVHLHPEDFARLQGVPFRAGTEIEADTEVARGEVHVTTPRGLLVRELDEVLEAVHESLTGDQQ